ncbi:MAG: hypothetical protein NUW07_02875 [Candidatus Saccharicenans sp.]|nr:hypothetical protein [Candidatus Saccharicenans sp.]MDH7492638.1 hypothetical protein [Candidatus Saccharicenans sp.]
MSGRHNRNGWSLILNLARAPRRNRRLYRWLLVGLSLGLLAAVAGLVLLNLNGLTRFHGLRQSNQVLKEKKASLASETRQLSREVENLRRLYREPVDEINSLLDRRAFSWVIFFNRMEAGLPPGSYLLALNPPTSVASREFKLRVALGSREELGLLIKNLQLQNFSEIRVLNENYQNNKFQVEMVLKDVSLE